MGREEHDSAKARMTHGGQRRPCRQDRAAKITVEREAIVFERRVRETLRDERSDAVNQRIERAGSAYEVPKRLLDGEGILEEIEPLRGGACARRFDCRERRIGRRRAICDCNVREAVPRERRRNAGGEAARRARN